MAVKAELVSPIGPDSKSPDYQLKERQIKALDVDADSGISLDAPLMDLSRTLAASPVLSIKQSEHLLDTLSYNGLLLYRSHQSELLDELYDRDLDAATHREEEAKLKSTYDNVTFDLEKDAQLQARTIAALSEFVNPALSDKNRLARTVTLLNAGHIASGASYGYGYEDTYNDYGYGVRKMEAIELDVYGQRVNYSGKLRSTGVATDDEIDGLENMTLEEFRNLRNYGQFYDQFIALHFLNNMNTESTTQLFRGFQEILYYGYAMGIRDGMVANDRNEFYSEDF